MRTENLGIERLTTLAEIDAFVVRIELVSLIGENGLEVIVGHLLDFAELTRLTWGVSSRAPSTRSLRATRTCRTAQP